MSFTGEPDILAQKKHLNFAFLTKHLFPEKLEKQFSTASNHNHKNAQFRIWHSSQQLQEGGVWVAFSKQRSCHSGRTVIPKGKISQHLWDDVKG